MSKCCPLFQPLSGLLFLVAPMLISCKAIRHPLDCKDVYEQDKNRTSGVYTIYPIGCTSAIQVYCDMDTDGGHWTVFQRRMDASVHFYMPWEAYRLGFGNAAAEYWLGLENIHQMTSQRDYELRVDMEDFEGNKVHALYSSFEVAAECDGYKLTVYGFSEGCTAGDSLTYHNGEKFSTFDKDQDSSSTNCAKLHMGGFWYKDCQEANPNGIYHWGRDSTMSNFGVEWKSWKGENYSLKAVSMKIRPVP